MVSDPKDMELFYTAIPPTQKRGRRSRGTQAVLDKLAQVPRGQAVCVKSKDRIKAARLRYTVMAAAKVAGLKVKTSVKGQLLFVWHKDDEAKLSEVEKLLREKESAA